MDVDTSAAGKETLSLTALLERYKCQRSEFHRTGFYSGAAALFKRRFGPALASTSKVVCLGLGTLTRVPSAKWDPESAMYQFIMLEHLLDFVVAARRKNAHKSDEIRVELYLQDPAFTDADFAMFAHQLPNAQVLKAMTSANDSGNAVNLPGAEPASDYIDEKTLLYVPFCPADVLMPCIEGKTPALVICADVDTLLQRWQEEIEDEAKRGRATDSEDDDKQRAAKHGIKVSESFLSRYEGYELTAFDDGRWDEPFGGLTVYRKREAGGPKKPGKLKQKVQGCTPM